MLVSYHPAYAHPLPKSHRFPMEKYDLIYGQLHLEGFSDDAIWNRPCPLDPIEILKCHTSEYWNKIRTGSWSRAEERKSGFTWSHALVLRESIIMNGTLGCALEAVRGGIGLNIAGGTHHAFSNRAEGFCLLNDFAISAQHLLDNTETNRVLIVDLDVHQGNGTAAMTQTDDRVFTFSMHAESNYPFHKEHSTLDIPLPDGTTDHEYLEQLENHLHDIFSRFAPQVVFYQCGVDVLSSDKLGKLSLTMRGSQERDSMVLEMCRKHNVGVACAMGGGYSEDVSVIVEAHMQTFRLARDLWC